MQNTFELSNNLCAIAEVETEWLDVKRLVVFLLLGRGWAVGGYRQ